MLPIITDVAAFTVPQRGPVSVPRMTARDSMRSCDDANDTDIVPTMWL